MARGRANLFCGLIIPPTTQMAKRKLTFLLAAGELPRSLADLPTLTADLPPETRRYSLLTNEISEDFVPIAIILGAQGSSPDG